MKKTYEYPKKVTDENFQKLVDRAKEITRKSSITLATAVIVSIGLLVLFLLIFVIPPMRTVGFPDPSTFAITGLGISFALSLFTSFYLIYAVNIFLRRVFNNYVSYYPSPEEFVFAHCILIAKAYAEKERRSLTLGVKSLCREFSAFTRRDSLNYRRRFYASEFKLLACGEIQIGRMLLFSKQNMKELLTNFALALVNHDDPKAFSYLKQLIDKIEKFGKIENLKEKLERQLKSMKAIITFITTLITVSVTLWGLFH